MRQPKTLYLLDDDSDDLDFFCEAVSVIDREIICVRSSDSDAALKAFNASDVPVPDIIFLDLNMPLIDGRKFLMELKKLKAYAHVPVIIYTTSSHSRDREETIGLGAADFLTKPCSLGELVRELGLIFARYSYAVITK